MNLNNQIDTKQEELNRLFRLLNTDIGYELITPKTNFIYPQPPVFIIETNFAVSQMIQKIETLYKAQLLTQEKTNSQLKFKRWGTASVSVGVGLSASANSFSRLSNNRMTDYNAGGNMARE